MKLWLYKIDIARYGIHTTSFLGNNQSLSGDAIHQAFYKKKTVILMIFYQSQIATFENYSHSLKTNKFHESCQNN